MLARKCFSFPLCLQAKTNRGSKSTKPQCLNSIPQKLRERTVAAKEAVQLRLKDIQGDADHHAERQQIEDALSSLRTIEREK